VLAGRRAVYYGRSAVEREFGRLKHEYGLSAPRAWPWPRPATRWPCGARPPLTSARASAGRTARGVAAP